MQGRPSGKIAAIDPKLRRTRPRRRHLPSMHSFPTALTFLAGLLLASVACAQDGNSRAAESDACIAPSPDCVVVGQLNVSISLGIGGRTNPVATNSDIPLVAIPRISWYGKRFFLENLDLGFTLYEDSTHTFNLVATPGYDRVFFHRNDLQNVFVGIDGGFAPVVSLRVPLRERHTTYLVGPEWAFTRGKLSGQLDALYEVTGEHDGFEVRAAISVPLSEGRGALVASAGLTWKSAELVDYYYGVEGFYVADAALNPFVKLAYTRPLSERWTFNAFAHYEYLGDSVADSPIIDDASVATAFVGFVARIF